MSIDETTETETADMADMLGVSARRLQQLAAAGWIKGKTNRNRWNVHRTAGSYLKHVAQCALLGYDPSYK